jgi:hypothetical protein
VTILVNAARLYRAEEREPAPEAKAVKRQRATIRNYCTA